MKEFSQNCNVPNGFTSSFYFWTNTGETNEHNEWIKEDFKGYLRCKFTSCDKVALDVQLMIFFIWRKNGVSFSRYLDFCIFVKSTDFKIGDVS